MSEDKVFSTVAEDESFASSCFVDVGLEVFLEFSKGDARGLHVTPCRDEALQLGQASSQGCLSNPLRLGCCGRRAARAGTQ